MKLQRLFEMRPAELAFRGRQHLAQTVELLAAPGGKANPVCRFDSVNQDAAFQAIVALLERGDHAGASLQLLQRFEQLAPARFFAGASEAGVELDIAAHDTEARQKIIESANGVCREEFEILGYGRLAFGSPVNWQLDAVSGVESAPGHGSRIDYLAHHRVGDSKVVWELNRQQWLLDLGQAWRFTGKEHYAATFARLMQHWMQANPPGFGINWSSSLEASMRLISWCWALFLFRGSAALTPALFLQMLAWIQAHARYVERNLSRYFSPNTHLTGEALGLFYAGTLFPELKGGRRWQSLGSKILQAQLQCQVDPSGVYFEQSTRYQYYTVEIYIHFLILAERNAVRVPDRVREHLEQMVRFLLHLRRPDGTLPQIGDTDGGWLLPLVRREPGDFGGLFSIAAAVLQNRHFAWAAGAVTAETRWLLGSPEQKVDGKGWSWPTPLVPTEVLRCFREGGYVVMRSGWDRRAHQLIFDTGPLGCHVSGGHGHADLLSVQCSAWGESFLVDAGTFCYTADAEWRNFFRSSAAHSTALVDGLGQAQPAGPFSWQGRPAALLRQCKSIPGYSLADAEHHAYARLNDPVTHRRRVVFVQSAFWLIIDDLAGREEHRIDLRYQFAPIPVAAEADGWVRGHGTGCALLVKAFSNALVTTSIKQGQRSPLLGWLSPNYGQRVPAPALTFSATARLPLRIVTLLFPLEDPAACVPEVTPLWEQGALAGVQFTSGDTSTIFIGDDEIVVRNRT